FDEEELTARYEKRYKATFAALSPPRVQAVTVDVQIYPAERRLTLGGEFALANRSAGPIEKVLVRLPETARVDRLSFGRGERLAVDDREVGVRVYELGRPLAPDETAKLTYSLSYAPKGLEQGHGDLHVVQNGTFVNNQQVLPQLGYSDGVELL